MSGHNYQPHTSDKLTPEYLEKIGTLEKCHDCGMFKVVMVCGNIMYKTPIPFPSTDLKSMILYNKIIQELTCVEWQIKKLLE